MYVRGKCLTEDYIGSETGTCLGRSLFFGLGILGFQLFQLFHYINDRHWSLFVLSRQPVQVVGQLITAQPVPLRYQQPFGYHRRVERVVPRAKMQLLF